MIAKVLSFGLFGIEPYPVEVEVDVSSGLPTVTLVGMADTAIRESKERVKTAIKNSGFNWPEEKITISLAPSAVKKEGASFDLAIALGILAASAQIDSGSFKQYCILGELSLDGSLRLTKGILPIAVAASGKQIRKILVPAHNAREAAIVPSVSVWPLQSLRQTVEFLHDPSLFPPFKPDHPASSQLQAQYPIDFSEVKGQYAAKRAMEVAAAGGHNLLMIGPPGSGKTMLSRRIPTIMPGLTFEEALEITTIHSIMGILPAQEALINTRPFRAPHHSSSSVALVGGGSVPQPGEISLAHHGVLFLDELPEFRRDCLEALRQPLEEGRIHVSRIAKSQVFPASCMLVAAMNPCPCGYYTDPKKACRCTPNRIAGYIHKISGPLLDRIDIHLSMPAIRYNDLCETKDAEPSAAIKERVEKTRAIQAARFKNEAGAAGRPSVRCNARMGTKQTKKYCILAPDAQGLLKTAMTDLGLSARAYGKVIKLSRTIADMAGSDMIRGEHIAEAIQYRSLDRNLF